MEVAGANRRWRCPFRCRGSRHESAVAQLSTLGSVRRHHKNMKTKTTSIIAAFAAFVYWQALAVIAAVGYPVHTNDRLIWYSLCAAVIFWAVADYGFISRRKHGHDHAA